MISQGCAVYRFDGRQLPLGAADFELGLAAAHRAHQRPRCICTGQGAPMYVAKLGGRYVLKRMPGTGSRHAVDCVHHEPSDGVAELAGGATSAIREDMSNGVAFLRLGFPMSRAASRNGPPVGREHRDRIASRGTRLSLSELLNYLWGEAGLTLWRPSFAGRRTWHVVRRRLLAVAAQKVAGNVRLSNALYVPEMFAAERREEIIARRTRAFDLRLTPGGDVRPLMLLIGEVKEISPAQPHCRVIIKHVPDQPFALDRRLYRLVCERYASELSLWATSGSIRMMLIATFGTDGRVPAIEEFSLMPVTLQWTPLRAACVYAPRRIEHIQMV